MKSEIDGFVETQDELDNIIPQDNEDMMRMGKIQQFKRNFQVVSITSFTVVAIVGWAFVPSNAASVIPVAGTGGAIVFFFVNFFGFLPTALSLAEMASMAPTAGGQYHWTSEFAPPRMQKVLSYLSGWLSSLSWLVGVASGQFLAANIVPALIAVQHPTFEPRPWHGYLILLAFLATCFIVNAFFSKHLPSLEGIMLALYTVAYLSILITILVLSPKLTSSEVFQDFKPYDSLITTRKLIPAQVFLFYAIGGFDSAAHLAEETRSAATVIPKAMVWSYCINGLLVFSMLLTVCFCWVHPEIYLNSKTGYPFLDLLTTATRGSTTGAVAIGSVIVTMIVLATINYMASTSRQVFAFARDNGLPFSRWIAKVDRKRHTPINALIFVVVFSVLLDLIGLGSEIAFNAIISLQTMAIAGTYQVSLLSLVWRRLFGQALPPAKWSLGRLGLPLNIFSIIYGWYLLVYASMPAEYPVTAQNMNWAPVMFGAILLLCFFYYMLWARNIYEGPVVKVRRL